MLEGMRTLKKLTIECAYMWDTFDVKCDSLEQLVVWRYYGGRDLLRSIGRAFPNLHRLEFYRAYTGLNRQGDYLKYLPDVPVVRFYDSVDDFDVSED